MHYRTVLHAIRIQSLGKLAQSLGSLKFLGESSGKTKRQCLVSSEHVRFVPKLLEMAFPEMANCSASKYEFEKLTYIENYTVFECCSMTVSRW
jgi:hypothetical protein